MKHIYPVVFTVLAFVFVLQMHAQTSTNIERLNELSIIFSNEWNVNKEKVIEYCQQNNLPIRQELEDGRIIQMINVENGIPLYYSTSNRGAATTTRADKVWPDGGAGFNLTGAGYNQIGQWDGGHVRQTHTEFTDQGESRVINMDGSSPTHYHATHVAGTIVAAGVNGNAKGMAYEGELMAWDWNSDNSEMAQAAADGLEISNHSYTFITGWSWTGSDYQWYGNPGISPTEDYKFGFYTYDARALDEIAYYAPNYLIIRSAGNDRGEGPSNAGQGDNPERDGGTDGYDCIPPESISKNILTVGAVKQVSSYTGPNDVDMSSFSSWGPADDGRIKPDIVGKGVGVYSTDDSSDDSYMNMDGTSMSSPNVAGSAALLQQHYQNLYAAPMWSATLKGLIIHTADEAGNYDGPDYIFGWGLMNTERAAQIISQDTLQNVVDQLVLKNEETFSRTVTAPGDTVLRVTICWTDVKGDIPGASLNPRVPILVNDLDIRIVGNGNTYYPYMLNPEDPSAEPTTDAKNNVDNVEQIYIADAPAGSYNIYVEHDGELTEGEQAFTMIISGITDLPYPGCSETLLSPEPDAEDLFLNQLISWEAAVYASSYDVYFGTDGEGVSTPTNVYNGENFELNEFYYILDPESTYYMQIVPRNDQGTAEGCNQIWTFSTMGAITAYPFIDTYAEATPPAAPFGYQIIDNSEANWVSTEFFGHTDNSSMLCLHPDGLVETDYDNWLISPPFVITGQKEYDISFYYMNPVPGTNESVTLYWTTDPNPEVMTDKVFQDINFDENGWQAANGVLETENDEVVFFAFHISSNDGYGVYMDDFTVDGWTVGFEDIINLNDPKIYAYNEKIYIQANEEWLGADMKIVNLMGQTIYSGKYQSATSLDIDTKFSSGLFIVSIIKGNKQISKKILLK